VSKTWATVSRIQIAGVYFLIFLNIIVYFYWAIWDFQAQSGFFLSTIYTLVFLYCLGAGIYTHFKACHTNPGSPEKIVMKQLLEAYIPPHQICSPELRNLLKSRNKSYQDLRNFGF